VEFLSFVKYGITHFTRSDKINHEAITITDYVCQHSSISNRASQEQMYCIILPHAAFMAPLYFSTLSQKTQFPKTLQKTKCVIFSTVLSETNFILRLVRPHITYHKQPYKWSSFYCCQTHLNLTIFETSSNIKFCENPSSGGRVVASRETWQR
jgi:hypothetical protein